MKFEEPLEEHIQIELFNKYIESNDPGIRETLIIHNLKLVSWVVNKYYSTNKFEVDDLFQSGVIGLIRAIEGYEPTRGSFSTYAISWIRQAITRDISNNGDVVRIPIYMLQEISELKKAQTTLIKKLQRNPTVAELSKNLGKDIHKVNKLLSIMQDTISLNVLTGEEDSITLEDTIKDDSPTPDILVEDKMFLEAFKKVAKEKLSKFQYDLIIMYYGVVSREYTLKEIAVRYGYGVEYIRQERDKALRILRRTRYFQEIQAEVNERTSFVRSIDYTQPRVLGGERISPVERLVLERERTRNYLMQKKRKELNLNDRETSHKTNMLV